MKTGIDHNQALLELHAPPGAADAYDAYVYAARKEAGQQTHEAWKAAPAISDEGVNLHAPLSRGDSQAARHRLLEVMQTDLQRRWYKPNSRSRNVAADAGAPVASAKEPPLSIGFSDVGLVLHHHRLRTTSAAGTGFVRL